MATRDEINKILKPDEISLKSLSGANRGALNTILNTIDKINQNYQSNSNKTADPASVDLLSGQIAFFLDKFEKDSSKAVTSTEAVPKPVDELRDRLVNAVNDEKIKKDLPNKIEQAKTARILRLKKEIARFTDKNQNAQNLAAAGGEADKTQVKENQTETNVVSNQGLPENSKVPFHIDDRPFNPEDMAPNLEEKQAAQGKKNSTKKGLFNNLKNYIKENPVKGGLLIAGIAVGVAAIAVASVFTGGGAAIAAGIGVGALLGGGTMTTGIIAFGATVATMAASALGMASNMHAAKKDGAQLSSNESMPDLFSPFGQDQTQTANKDKDQSKIPSTLVEPDRNQNQGLIIDKDQTPAVAPEVKQDQSQAALQGQDLSKTLKRTQSMNDLREASRNEPTTPIPASQEKDPSRVLNRTQRVNDLQKALTKSEQHHPKGSASEHTNHGNRTSMHHNNEKGGRGH